jgi:IMP dehydrogenase
LNCDLNALLSECKKLLYKNKIEKIPILNTKKEIVGLVSLKDILEYEERKFANKDESGRLFVGAAVGANKDYL